MQEPMKKITLSLIDPPGSVFEVLRKYETEMTTQVKVNSLSWDESRKSLGDYALFHSGPDVSGIGIHLLDHFFHMNVLRPFSSNELKKIGDKKVFPKANWEEVMLGGEAYAIPWSTDVRVVFYRRDFFAQLGIDEDTAFSTVSNMQNTLDKLQSLDGISPWVMPTAKELTPMQNMAMWVWHKGGSFMDATGRHPQFMEPDAVAGMKQYFSVYRPAIWPEAQSLSEPESAQLFRDGKAAAVLSGSWLLHPGAQFEPIVKENIGMAALPVPSFVGAQSLVIWRYAHNEKEAVHLLQFLCKQETQFELFVNTSYLPGRLDVLENPDFFKNEKLSQAYLNALKTGRGFKAKYMWGLAEDRISAAIYLIWQRLFADPDLDVEKTIKKIMKPVSVQLERMMNP
jgi:multiple sugar transport system substrate-binding protein